jgi:hypothetical protein
MPMGDVFAALYDNPRWIAWRNEPRGPAGKLSKVPYNPRGGYASSTDPATWGSYAEAKAASQRLLAGYDLGGGVGLVLGDLGGDLYICGLDLDSCLDDGLVADWAAEIIATTRSYGECSPSGTGIKTFFYVEAADVRPFLDKINVQPDGWGCRRSVGSNSADHGPAVEVYCASRYFAVTHRRWAQTPDHIAVLDHVMLADLAQLVPAGGAASSSAGAGPGGDQSRSAAAFRLARKLIAGGCTYDEMVAALKADPVTVDWVREKGKPAGERELKRLWAHARPEISAGVTLADFRAYMPQHNYIYAPTRELWPAKSVNSRLDPVQIGTDAATGDPIKISAAAWLDRHQPVEQLTWAPGEPMIVDDRLIADGGWIERAGVHVFNLYRPPTLSLGDPAQAGRWCAHVEKVYPDDFRHITRWLAQRTQRPDVKINHVLVLGGLQGIGKDSLLEPVKRAVGPWNWAEPSPLQVMGRFNGFAKSVILRISEAHDLGDLDRFAFYEHLKVYAAAPPDVLRVDEKNLREHAVLNCCGVVITSNHKTDGIYLPADDRRHYVAWSSLTKDDFDDAYWRELWNWYDQGGDQHVAAFLVAYDLADFNPKAPPPKTEAFWTIVNAGRSPEDAELADCLELLGDPEITTLARVAGQADQGFHDWLKDRKNRRIIPHRFEACGYVPVRNPDAADGLWKIGSQRMAAYGKANLSLPEQIAGVRARLSGRCSW